MTILLPLRVKPETNKREHWRATHRRVASQRDAVALVMSQYRRALKELKRPVTVTLCNVAPRGHFDDDSLPVCFKAIRDQLAVELGLPVRKMAKGQKRPVANDNHPDVRWSYAQERGVEFAVRVQIEGSGE